MGRLAGLGSVAALVCVVAGAGAQGLKAHGDMGAAARANELPITRVALYKNGVGFFEHVGKVTGDQAVTIDFTSAQLNDVLQSLTAVDLNGGRISGAGYNSTTPLEQQLKSLPLALSDNPSDFDFYNAIRGARVAVTGPGVSITGRLLAIDLRSPAVKPKDADATETDDKGGRRFLTVVSDGGAVRTFELTAAVSVVLLDTALHTDVTRYLELLASTRNQGLRHLTLTDRGTGVRDLRVSYISEVPVWKSTYRILFTEGKTGNATLQGWTVVDNTTGSDWTNVHLDLIAGAPQSFIQPLSTPYYARRPEIGMPEEAQLEPQTHESGDEVMTGSGSANGVVGGMIGGTGASPSPKMMASPQRAVRSVSLGGSGNPGFAAMAPPPPTPAMSYEDEASASLVPQTTSTAFDDFFEYSLTDPITIRKNESALVPILQAKLPIERVTLWSEAQPVALRALWMTNSSAMTLDRGSFSIVENGNFGGEGLLDPIHPGERRLLSYAADQAVTVDARNGAQAAHKLRLLKVSKGVLEEHFRDTREREYNVRNAGAEARTVLVEHARSTGFDLSSDNAKPEETTPAVYRYRVVVPPHGTASVKVKETHSSVGRIQLGGVNDQQIAVYLQEVGPGKSDALRAQLQPVLDAQKALSALRNSRADVDRRLNDLRAEEERQRANIVALKDADKGAQKRFVDELGRIEDSILAAGKEKVTLDAQVAAAERDLREKVDRVEFEVEV